MTTHARKIASCLAALGTIALGGACADQSPTNPGVAPTVNAARLGGRSSARHVVVAKNGISRQLAAAITAAGGRIARTDDSIGVAVVDGLSDAAAATLATRSDVDGVDRDIIVRWLPPHDAMIGKAITAPRERSDQSGAALFATYQWNLRVIRASNAWLVTGQGKGALACILDTGIDPTHLDLAGKVDLGKSTSMVISEPFIEDLNAHGTFVSALVASNGIVMASVAPDARLCAVKVLDQTGSGSFADVISGIVFATNVGADVVNMSLGAYFSKKDPGAKELIKAMQRAVNFATRRGVLVVVAAGNDAVNFNSEPKDSIEIPAQLQNVISVGATAPVAQQNFDQIASYSDYGSKGVDVFAPGGDYIPGSSVLQDLILSACSSYSVDFPECADGQGYLLGAGTSFAAPHATGEAAVIESDFPRDVRGQRLAQCIITTADPVTGRRVDRAYGHGRIDVLNAASCGRGRSVIRTVAENSTVHR